MKEDFNRYWQRKVARNPKLLTHDVLRLEVSVFRRELEKAFEAGRDLDLETPSFMEKLFGRTK